MPRSDKQVNQRTRQISVNFVKRNLSNRYSKYLLVAVVASGTIVRPYRLCPTRQRIRIDGYIAIISLVQRKILLQIPHLDRAITRASSGSDNVGSRGMPIQRSGITRMRRYLYYRISGNALVVNNQRTTGSDKSKDCSRRIKKWNELRLFRLHWFSSQYNACRWYSSK